MAMRAQYVLADGTTAAPTIVADGSTPAVNWRGGDGFLMVAGTVGGGTYTLQIQAPDLTWLAVATGLTAVGVANFKAPAGPLRLTTSGSTAPSIKAWVIGVPNNAQGM